MKTLLMAFFYLTLMAYPAKAPMYSPSPFDLVFGNCGIRDPCFIAPNDGGQVYLFVQAARAVNRGDKNLVVINTACASACALFADMARERVCIGELAVFQFHKGTRLHWTGFRQYPLTPTLRYRARCTDILRSVQNAPQLKPAVLRSRRNSQVQIFFRTLFLFRSPCRALLFLCRRSRRCLFQTALSL